MNREKFSPNIWTLSVVRLLPNLVSASANHIASFFVHEFVLKPHYRVKIWGTLNRIRALSLIHHSWLGYTTFLILISSKTNRLHAGWLHFCIRARGSILYFIRNRRLFCHLELLWAKMTKVCRQKCSSIALSREFVNKASLGCLDQLDAFVLLEQSTLLLKCPSPSRLRRLLQLFDDYFFGSAEKLLSFETAFPNLRVGGLLDFKWLQGH